MLDERRSLSDAPFRNDGNGPTFAYCARSIYFSLMFSLLDMASCVCPLKLLCGGSSLLSFCARGSCVGWDAESMFCADGDCTTFSEVDCAAWVLALRSPVSGSSMFRRCASGSCDFVSFSVDDRAGIVEDINLDRRRVELLRV